MNICLQPRDLEILLWILHMKFATCEDITKVFFKGCNPNRSPYRRLLKLKSQGLLEAKRIYQDSRDYYVATWETVKFLRSIGCQYVPALPKRGAFFNCYEHDKRLINLRIFAQELGLGPWIPERVIRSIKPHGACPDAILYNFDRQYAVEYEYSEKDKNRYIGIFDRYQNKEKYDAALYIFSTERQLKRILKKVSSTPKKIYFISEEKLFTQKDKAIFESSWGPLGLTDLLYYSSSHASIDDVEKDDLRELVHWADPEHWKEKKPFIPFGGGGGRKQDDQEEDRLSHSGDESDELDYYPSIYPSIYPNERDQNGYEDPSGWN